MNGPDNLGGDTGSGAPDASEGMDLDSILGGTSGDTDTASGAADGLSRQGDGSTGQSNAFRFAGRTWGGQKQAEAAWNKMYGGYSERQGLVNQLKNVAQNNPELAAQLAASDPKLAAILAKLGIEAVEADSQDMDPRGGREQAGMDDIRHEIGVERHQNRILREEWAFERKLGRPITEAEQQAVYKQLERSESLTYDEAYFLAHRQQIMKQQAQSRAASGAATPDMSGRPKPPPRSMPGTAAPGKKSVADMSEQEWKDNLRQSGAIKDLLSRGMSQR